MLREPEVSLVKTELSNKCKTSLQNDSIYILNKTKSHISIEDAGMCEQYKQQGLRNVSFVQVV